MNERVKKKYRKMLIDKSRIEEDHLTLSFSVYSILLNTNRSRLTSPSLHSLSFFSNVCHIYSVDDGSVFNSLTH